MGGRLQNVAAFAACLWAIASSSQAHEPIGLAGVAPRDPTALELSQSTAVERWSLRADSWRGAWDSTDSLSFPRFDWRSAISGDVARANISFDWQRRIAGGQLAGGAFARLARTDVGDGARQLTALEQRLHESTYGAALRWSGGSAIAGIPASHSITAGFRSTGRDASAGATDERGVLQLYRDDRLSESAFSVAAATQLALPGRIDAELGVRYDMHRIGVRTDAFSREGEVIAQTASPRLKLRAPMPIVGGEVFLAMGRGLAMDARNSAALSDPRGGVPVARLDPAATMDTVEIGFRRRLPLGIETTVSMFRAKSDLELLLTGESAITEFSRPTVRQGVQVAARYEPLSWLALDFQGSTLQARFDDRAYEFVPGAAQRNASAAATLHSPAGWTASVALNYLGKRAGVDEPMGIRDSFFVNARFAYEMTKRTRVSLDLFNILDQRLRDIDYFSASRLASPSGDYLFNPAEPRGFRLRLRTEF